MTTGQKSNTDSSDKVIAYRLTQVELAIKNFGEKFDRQENIKKADLIEFRDAILEKFKDKTDAIQADIDELKENKADKKYVDDLRGLVKAIGLTALTVIGGLITFWFTQGR